MISRENYSEEHIREIQRRGRGDPLIIERSMFAFGLLEALKRVGLEFIFKGGTSLMLLLPEPRRLSTDIDIVVEPDTDIDRYIKEASEIFPFRDMNEQVRVGKNDIVKRHFKFTYDSPLKGEPLYILLDVLFEENHYRRVIKKEIANSLLLTEGENLEVRVPSNDCILGDKMTAFAPHTTGVPLRAGKDMEVIKQFFDVGTLIDVQDNFDDLRQTYFEVSKSELGFRGNPVTTDEALLDTIGSAACIGSRGKYEPEDFESYLRGTRNIDGHMLDKKKYSMETAMMDAPKVIYMAACLLTGHSPERGIEYAQYKNEKLTQQETMELKAFRKINSDSYGLLVLADRMLQEYRS